MSYPRSTVDLSGYPDLVVIYLGYRAKSLARVVSLWRIGRGLRTISRNPPDGLLAHEGMLFGFAHPGFRQYWRDFDSLEAFTRGPVHQALWRDFAADPAGGAIWHETYRLSGGMEAIYSGIDGFGFGKFAPRRPPSRAASAPGSASPSPPRFRPNAPTPSFDAPPPEPSA